LYARAPLVSLSLRRVQRGVRVCVRSGAWSAGSSDVCLRRRAADRAGKHRRTKKAPQLRRRNQCGEDTTPRHTIRAQRRGAYSSLSDKSYSFKGECAIAVLTVSFSASVLRLRCPSSQTRIQMQDFGAHAKGGRVIFSELVAHEGPLALWKVSHRKRGRRERKLPQEGEFVSIHSQGVY
jgi:hypothetical protein